MENAMQLVSRAAQILFTSVVVLVAVSCTINDRQQQTTSPINLLEDSVVEYSLDAGFSYSSNPLAIEPRETIRFLAQTTFMFDPDDNQVSGDKSSYSVLEFTAGNNLDSRRMKVFINGVSVDIPLEGMVYKTIPAIDVNLLKSGQNILTAEFNVRNASREESMTLSLDLELNALRSTNLQFQTGPVLGAYDDDYFSVTCRTNMPAEAFVYSSEEAGTSGSDRSSAYLATSERGIIHRLWIPRPTDHSEEPIKYILAAERDGHLINYELEPVFPEGDTFRFIVTGDSRTYPERWQTVSNAITRVDAELMIHVGDFVTSGERDWEWDEQFWAPAQSLLSRMPFYVVIGNHEQQAPLFDEMIYSPSDDGRDHNWYQEKKGVLLIGVDGQKDWSAGSDNEMWLEEVLAGSSARFIFLSNHYPSWSSAGHGSVDKEGVPDERSVRESRYVVMPLLEKYQATAMFAGHDHCYERSEPPGGVSVIIAGGGGAPFYAMEEDAERQNPHSEVFATVLHYCLLEVIGDTCTMQVFTPDGEVIDTKTWKARGSR